MIRASGLSMVGAGINDGDLLVEDTLQIFENAVQVLLPSALEPLRQRAASWPGKPAKAFSQMLVAEYRPGTLLGWRSA